MTTIHHTPISAQERAAIRSNWAELHPSASARDFIVRAFLLGCPLAKHFTPITNSVKLANGQRPYQGVAAAARELRASEAGDTYRRVLGIPEDEWAAHRATPLHAERLAMLAQWSRDITPDSLPGASR